MRVVAIGIASLLSALRSAKRSSKSLTHNNFACFVIQLHVLKGVQVGLVKKLYGTTFSYHMEDFVSPIILTLKSLVIQRYPFRL